MYVSYVAIQSFSNPCLVSVLRQQALICKKKTKILYWATGNKRWKTGLSLVQAELH